MSKTKRKHVPYLLIHLEEEPFPFSCVTAFHLCYSVMAALALPLCQVIFAEMCVTVPFLCLRVTNPAPRLCRAESTYWLTNAAKHGPASQLLIPTDVLYCFLSCMGFGACWAQPWTSSAQYNKRKHLGRFREMSSKAQLPIHWFSRLDWLSGLSTGGRISETTKPCGAEQDEQKDWGGRDASKLLDQLYHQTVPEYPLYKHIPYLLLETVSWVS